ncbi:MAG: YhbY family RNA-binding protein, partial [Limisphaerales bacterium]
AFCCQLKEALSQHQLVKVRFLEFKDERKSMARHLADSVGCHLVTVVGHVAVFFQPAPLSDAQASGEESSESMA